MSLPDEIERIALLGWACYPCSRTSKHGCFKGATAAATCDLDVLERWNHEYRAPNWRIVFEPSGLWGIDLDIHDGKADGIAAFHELARGYTTLPRCPTTRSGGGGMAMFFRWQGEEIAGRTNYPAPGIDPRRGAQSVTVPPSVHPVTGRPYEWLLAPWEVSAPVAPDWLLRLFRPPPEPVFDRPDNVPTDETGRRILGWACRMVSGAPSGSANDTLNACAFSVARYVAAGVLSEPDAVAHLYNAANSRSIPGREAVATIKSAFRRGLTCPAI